MRAQFGHRHRPAVDFDPFGLGRDVESDEESAVRKWFAVGLCDFNVVGIGIALRPKPLVNPADAFAGTFHVNESYAQLQLAYDIASAGVIPDVVPCEVYCHSLTDPTILGDDLRRAGAQTLTCFALQLPERLAEHNR